MNTTAERRYRLLVLGCLAHAAFVAADFFINFFSFIGFFLSHRLWWGSFVTWPAWAFLALAVWLEKALEGGTPDDYRPPHSLPGHHETVH